MARRDRTPKRPPEHFVTFCGIRCKVEQACYAANNSRALQLIDPADGELVATATVCVPYFTPIAGQALIKDWSENEGILDALVEAKIVEDTGSRIPCGYTSAALVWVL